MKQRLAVDIWRSALEELQGKVSAANYDTWLRNTVGLSQRDGSLVVGVPSTFVTESLEKRLHPLIEKTVGSIAGRPLSVQFQVHLGQGDADLGPVQPPTTTQFLSQRPSPTKFNRRYTFDTFLVGTCNRLAHAASQRVAQDPGGSYNPLFIYGGADQEAVDARAHYESFTGEVGIPTSFVTIDGANHDFYSLEWERRIAEATLERIGRP